MQIKRVTLLGLIFAIFTVLTVVIFPAKETLASSIQKGCDLPVYPGSLKTVLGGCAVPINDPDQFAWELFTYLNHKASIQGTTSDDNFTNNAIWETWADDPLTFPDSPDPNSPPQWPDQNPPAKQLRLRSKVERSQSGSDFIQFQGNEECTIENAPCEEVRRNKPTFDYIIQNNLWYTQGLEKAFTNAQNALSNGEPVQDFIKLPIDSIEVKGDWVPISEGQKSQFHWNYDAKGDLYGLIAMHISSKALPNWFWATFEWVGNYGRCDYIGCHDSFGVCPHTVEPKQQINQPYPPGKLTPQLLALFEKKGLTGEWSKEWQNYRLKGSQFDFTDSTGQPLLLGNSITEQGFVPTASCITCHSRAAVTSKGKDSYPLAGFRPSLPGVGEPRSEKEVGLAEIKFPSGPLNQSYNGTPDPNWFYRYTTSKAMLDNLQMDFVWAIPFNAKPAPKPLKKSA